MNKILPINSYNHGFSINKNKNKNSAPKDIGELSNFINLIYLRYFFILLIARRSLLLMPIQVEFR